MAVNRSEVPFLLLHSDRSAVVRGAARSRRAPPGFELRFAQHLDPGADDVLGVLHRLERVEAVKFAAELNPLRERVGAVDEHVDELRDAGLELGILRVAQRVDQRREARPSGAPDLRILTPPPDAVLVAILAVVAAILARLRLELDPALVAQRIRDVLQPGRLLPRRRARGEHLVVAAAPAELAQRAEHKLVATLLVAHHGEDEDGALRQLRVGEHVCVERVRQRCHRVRDREHPLHPAVVVHQRRVDAEELARHFARRLRLRRERLEAAATDERGGGEELRDAARVVERLEPRHGLRPRDCRQRSRLVLVDLAAP